jgi:dipeptidyl aminopeptidase/acylaminoacyl peptidase
MEAGGTRADRPDSRRLTRTAALAGAAVVLFGLLADSGPARRTTFPGPNGLLTYTLSQLFVVNPDGTGARAVTTSTPERPIRAFQPGWAPDGNRITFANTVGTSVGGGIWVINADGTGGARVPSTEQNDAWPTFSPDGRQIAFVRFQNRYYRLHVINVDGTGLRIVMPDASVHVEDPEWSPDGSRFAFSNGGDLFVVNADGTGLVNLTGAESGNARHPSWSPDGSRIAYAILNEVKAIPSSGGASTTIVGGLREVWEVSWSPDGTQIAFVNDQADTPQEELYVANADGSNVRRLNVDTETTVDWGRQSIVPPPVAGVSVNVAPVSGVVRVRVRGTNRFVSLASLRNVRVGSELDVTRGRVRLTSAARAGRTQTGVFSQGRGVVQQERATRLTTMTLSGRLVCPRRSSSSSGGAPRPRVRRLWGNATGRFRTRGRFSSATVRGTVWLTEDRCDGTLVRVRTGRVAVRDFAQRRTVVVRAGQSYFARARTARASRSR